MISHNENVKQVFLRAKTQHNFDYSTQNILQCIQGLKMEVYA